MAVEKKAKVKEVSGETMQVEIIKFHPLVAHEVGEEPILTKETAEDLIERGFARAVKK